MNWLRNWIIMFIVIFGLGCIQTVTAEDVSALRLVPFPKRVELRQGTFSLERKLVLETPATSAKLLARQLGEELRLAGLEMPEVRDISGNMQWLRLSCQPGIVPSKPIFREHAATEDYLLNVQSDEVVCFAPSEIGLAHGIQTLCQLIRANRRGNAFPCLSISDWPSLTWRAFQDDMTRGPSATLDTLKREIDLGTAFKMNMFTYYMEYQYAFSKHPNIGPKDGSLMPAELKALVEYAKPRHMEILGCQQSFGHSSNILSHPEYADVRETADILSPAKEETYKLLDELYSDVAPLLPFPWFNVCCDETQGLKDTNGPAKELVKQNGEGAVYVQHLRRIHDILKNKYNKRMMMWGDIIIQHPDKLAQIPKDTIMLTWAYDPRANFEGQIIPFTNLGYEFFVCPGVDDWSRILPDFGNATVNIQNFVRDGVKHHALGMINTEWKDDAGTLRAPLWHGYAWGAECAWNAAVTKPDDFNRRIGAVLFGEKGSHFGQAIELLTKVHRLPVVNTGNAQNWPQGLQNSRFWQDDFAPKTSRANIHEQVDPLLALVRPAIQHLEACKKGSVVNGDLLDAFLLGAHRIELIGQRMLDGLEAAQTYTEAINAIGKDNKLAKLAKAEQLVRRNRDAHETLGKEFARIWHSESKPYALDRTMNQYVAVAKRYDDLVARIADARKKVEAGAPLPKPSELGLALP